MKFLILFIALLLSFPVLAIPSPYEIEQQVKSGNLPKAAELSKQVISEMPNSARAHYNYGQVLEMLGDHNAAYAELKKAIELDRSLSFAKSPDKFRNIMSKIEINIGKADAPRITNNPMSSSEKKSMAFDILLIILFAVFSFGIYFLFRKNKARKKELLEEKECIQNQLKELIDINTEIDELKNEIELSSHVETIKDPLRRKLRLVEDKVVQCIYLIKDKEEKLSLNQIGYIKDDINYIQYKLNRSPDDLKKDMEAKENKKEPDIKESKTLYKKSIEPEVKKENITTSTQTPQPITNTVIEDREDSNVSGLNTGLLVADIISNIISTASQGSSTDSSDYKHYTKEKSENDESDIQDISDTNFDSGNDTSNDFDTGNDSEETTSSFDSGNEDKNNW